MRQAPTRLPFVLAVALLPATQVLHGQESRGSPFLALDTIVRREMRELGAAGVAIAIVRGDSVVYAQGYGVRDTMSRIPVTPDMLFRVVSITKMFTATLILSLAEERRLGLDQPIATYLPWLPPRLGGITLHQLLTLSSGLRDAFALQPAYDPVWLERTCREIPDSIAFTGMGPIWSYSNQGYALAGCVAQTITDTLFPTLLAERVLRPLGMHRATLNPLEAMTGSLAVGHDWTPSGPRLRRVYSASATHAPAQDLIVSANELARFATAVMNRGRIAGSQAISPYVVERLLRAEVDATHWATTDPTRYGYGLFHRAWRGIQVVEHPGLGVGFAAELVMVPAERFAIIVLANTNGTYFGDTKRRALELSVRLAPRLSSTHSEARTSDAAEAIGTYGFGFAAVRLVDSNGRLAMQQDTSVLILRSVHRDVYLVPNPSGPIKERALYIIRDASGRPAAVSYIGRVWPRNPPTSPRAP